MRVVCAHLAGWGFDAAWQADVSGEKAQSQEAFGLLLICVHVSMVVAVLFQGYVTMQVCFSSLSLHDDTHPHCFHCCCFFVCFFGGNIAIL